nr:hypothetical protein CFP56_04406 [Quercus suber]
MAREISTIGIISRQSTPKGLEEFQVVKEAGLEFVASQDPLHQVSSCYIVALDSSRAEDPCLDRKPPAVYGHQFFTRPERRGARPNTPPFIASLESHGYEELKCDDVVVQDAGKVLWDTLVSRPDDKTSCACPP